MERKDQIEKRQSVTDQPAITDQTVNERGSETAVRQENKLFVEIERLGDYQVLLVKGYDQQLLDRIVDLDQRVFQDGSATDAWVLVPLIRYGQVFLLGHEEQGIAGSAMLMRDWHESQDAYLYSYAISPAVQGQGLGSMFLSAVLHNLKQQGIKKVTLTVRPENTAAIRVYEKQGFKIQAVHEHEYGQGQRRYIMVLNF